MNMPLKFPLRIASTPIRIPYEPGNGARYDVFMHRLENREGELVFALINFGTCYVFSHDAHPQYVAEKLRLNLADAEIISKLINLNI